MKSSPKVAATYRSRVALRWPLCYAIFAASILLLAPNLPSASGASPANLSQWTEKRLIKDLLYDYDKRSRPVVDGITPTVFDNEYNVQQITIHFGLQLIQILDLNEMDQVLTTSTKSLYKWKDYHLIWDPTKYGGIESVNIPTSKLWLPDIALYNYADERLEERRECDARVLHDGTVMWHPMAIYKSTCPVHIKYFPFDKQSCHLKFGPWTYDGFRVNISFYNSGQGTLDLENYVPSPEWNIIGTKAKFKQYHYPCCIEPYPDISFYIGMERQPAFYNYILILPCFLLSSLTLVLFWLPPETPAKMVLGMNIFVAFFLLLLLLEDTTPSASSNFPLIGTYYCINMGIITLSTFLSVIVVNFHFRGDNRKEVPFWLKKLAIVHGSRLLLIRLTPAQKPPKPEEMPLRPSVYPDGRPMGGTAAMMADGQRSNNVDSQRSYSRNPTIQQPQSIMDLLITQDSTDMSINRTRPLAGSSHGPTPSPPAAGPNAGPQPPGQLDEFLINYLCPNDQRKAGSEQMLHNASDTPRSHHHHHHHHSHHHHSQQPPAPPTPLTGSMTRHPFQQGSLPRGQTPPPPHQFYQHHPHRQRSESGDFDDCSPTSGHGLGGPGIDIRTIRRINAVTKDVSDIVKSLRYIQRMNECKERVNRTVSEWRAVAMVLDRLFFICYVITIILSIILFFPQSGDELDKSEIVLEPVKK